MGPREWSYWRVFDATFLRARCRPKSHAISRWHTRHRITPAKRPSEFERIAQTPSEAPDVQREATLQAADLYDKADNPAKSRAMLEAFVKHFPQPLNPAMEARNKLSLITARPATIGARDYWLKDIIAADRSAGPARTDRSRALGGQGHFDPGGTAARGVQEHQIRGRRSRSPLRRNAKRWKRRSKLMSQLPIIRLPKSRPRPPSRARSCTANWARI